MAYFSNSELSTLSNNCAIASKRIRGSITEGKIRMHYAASNKRCSGTCYVMVRSARWNISLQSFNHRSSYPDDHRVTAGCARSTLAFLSRMPVFILMLSFRSSSTRAFSSAIDPREEESAGFLVAFVFPRNIFLITRLRN